MILVESGKKLTKKDIMSKSDPYVIVKIDGNERQTKVQKNTNDPKWNEKVCLLTRVFKN